MASDKIIAKALSVAACLTVLAPIPGLAWPGGPTQRLLHAMQVVGVEAAPDQVRYNDCLQTSSVTRGRTIIWRQGQSERWAIAYALGEGPVSPSSVRSSRFFCDDSVEFLPEQMNFEQCEQWHSNVKALAPTSEHRLRHIYREASGEVSGIFCTSPTDCVMMQVRTDTGVALPGYALPLDYGWD